MTTTLAAAAGLFLIGLALTAFFSGVETGFFRAPRVRLQLDALAKFAESDNAKIVVPFESAGLLGAAQTLRSVLAAAPADGNAP